MSKKIIITGAAGFLGSNLLRLLRDDFRYSVYALTSRPEELRKFGGSNIHYCEKNIFKANTILSHSIIINCAFPRNATGGGTAEGIKYIQCLFEESIEQEAEAIINISSQSVYSPVRTEPATEETCISLDSAYAVGKYATELLLESICKGQYTRYSNIRMASLIGPEFDQRIVNKLAANAAVERIMKVNVNERRFGFLDVQDACKGIASLLELDPRDWKHIYNLGNGAAYTVYEIAVKIKAVFELLGHRDIQIQATYNDESGNTGVSGKRLQEDTGFFPEISLDESIKRIVDAMINL